jgi:branched-chain amino acid transport system substrate-binding protein
LESRWLAKRHQEEEMSMSRTSRLIAFLLVVICTAGLVACGDDDDGSAQGDTSASAQPEGDPKCGDGTGEAATGEPIPVGGMTTASNGPDLTQGPKSAQAFFDCLNANGGINGQPVEYSYEDDGLNPATATRAANSLVNDKQVVAIVGSVSYLECPVAGPIYQKADVIELEGAGGPAQCFTLPNINSVSQGGVLSTSLAVQDLIANGSKKIALLGPNTPGLGQAFIDAAERTAGANGGELVAGVLHKPGIRDATSVLLEAADAGPDAIVIVGVEQDLVSILKAAEAQGMKDRFKFAAAAPLYSPTAPEALGAYWHDGAVRVAHQFAPYDAETPDNQLWHDVMDEYAPDTVQDEFSQGAFLTARMFADTVAAISGPIDRTSVSEALQGIEGYETDLLCEPWSWEVGDFHVSNQVGRIATINADGEWEDVGECTAIKDPLLEAAG